MVDYLRVADRAWPLLGRVMSAHAALYRATSGRVGGRFPGLPPMLLLDHLGARSGRRRTTPLVYMPDGDRLVVVAAKGATPGIRAGCTTCGPIRTPRCRSARAG